jgi:HD-like signal output (HDOD) protein
MSEVIARFCSKLNGDSAFIAGLLNQVGVLYILAKYDEYPKLLQDPTARQDLINEWAAPIGENIVTNWEFSEEIRATLNPAEDEAARPDNQATLVDVVFAAKASLENKGGEVCDAPASRRLKLKDEMMPEIMELYQLRIDSLASAVS